MLGVGRKNLSVLFSNTYLFNFLHFALSFADFLIGFQAVIFTFYSLVFGLSISLSTANFSQIFRLFTFSFPDFWGFKILCRQFSLAFCSDSKILRGDGLDFLKFSVLFLQSRSPFCKFVLFRFGRQFSLAFGSVVFQICRWTGYRRGLP